MISFPLACPVCGRALTQEVQALRCKKGHSFDIAAQGYVNLLLSSGKKSAHPGDDDGMVAARRLFLEKDYYLTLSDCINRLVMETLSAGGADAPLRVIDAGCCEGYYTSRLAKHLAAQGRPHAVLGVDLAKRALRYAARHSPDVGYAVASIFDLPVPDGGADAIVSICSPIAEKEFARVLHPGGRLILAVPSVRHLFGLKQIVYDHPYENDVKDFAFDGFRTLRKETVYDTVTVQPGDDIRALFQMTPYYWKSPADGAARLAALDSLDTEIHFDVFVLERITA